MLVWTLPVAVRALRDVSWQLCSGDVNSACCSPGEAEALFHNATDRLVFGTDWSLQESPEKKHQPASQLVFAQFSLSSKAQRCTLGKTKKGEIKYASSSIRN